MQNAIHIFGASGSGTTTLGKKICDELGFVLMDTDDYFWLSTNPRFTHKRPKSERIELMKRDIALFDNVVISGSLADWGDALIPYFTLAIRIDTEQNLRIARLKQREKERFGVRIEPGGDMYSQHIDFIEWAKTYDAGGLNQRSKAKHDEWQKLLSCDIIHLNGADDLNANFEKVRTYLGIKQ